jgi:hypothetical protein
MVPKPKRGRIGPDGAVAPELTRSPQPRARKASRRSIDPLAWSDETRRLGLVRTGFDPSSGTRPCWVHASAASASPQEPSWRTWGL